MQSWGAIFLSDPPLGDQIGGSNKKKSKNFSPFGSQHIDSKSKQAEAEVVPSSSLVEVEVEVEVGVEVDVEVEVDATLSFRHSLDGVANVSRVRFGISVGFCTVG